MAVTKTVTIVNDSEAEWTSAQEDVLLTTKKDLEDLSNASITYVVNIVPRPKKLPH